ncbi:MAG: hypothetical protein ACYS99_00180 [Planctomycetota bacterium]|jgi:hypothetical protein
MRSTFTTFTAVLVLLLLLLAGILAFPSAATRVRVEEEVRAFRALQVIAAAQHRFRWERSKESPAAGRGRYGFLADLMGNASDGGPYARLEFEGDAADESVTVGPYRVAVLLPDEDGRPVSAGSGDRVDPEYAARAFLVLAWPERPHTGHRAYSVNQTLLLAEHTNADGAFSGASLPGVPYPRLAERDAETGRLSVAGAFPEPWTVPLERVQKRWLRNHLGARGVPVPEGLADRKKKED